MGIKNREKDRSEFSSKSNIWIQNSLEILEKMEKDIPSKVIQNSLFQVLIRTIFLWFIKESRLSNNYKSENFNPDLWGGEGKKIFYLNELKRALIGAPGDIKSKQKFLEKYLDIKHLELDIFQKNDDVFIDYPDSLFINDQGTGLFDILDSYEYTSEDLAGMAV